MFNMLFVLGGIQKCRAQQPASTARYEHIPVNAMFLLALLLDGSSSNNGFTRNVYIHLWKHLNLILKMIYKLSRMLIR